MTTLCFECDAIADHWHHVVPKSKGGVRTIPLCQQCHAKVHSPHLLVTRRLTKDALDIKRQKGERVGAIPYGYDLDFDGVHLRRNDHELAVIAKINEWRKNGMRYNKIARRLNSEGVTTKNGKKWHATQIWNIVRRSQEKLGRPKMKQGVLF
jgi:hypothetical protein